MLLETRRNERPGGSGSATQGKEIKQRKRERDAGAEKEI
jgi:hypothetical protein